MAGKKWDTGKTPWGIAPLDVVARIVDVMGHGAAKYGKYNWRDLAEARERYYAAAMRHLIAWYHGETSDPDSGLHHLAHAGCNVVFLLWFETHGYPDERTAADAAATARPETTPDADPAG